MKSLTVCLLLFLLLSCQDVRKEPVSRKAYQNVLLVIIPDDSKSFVNRCPKITPAQLKPLCDKMAGYCNIDIRTGIISADSHTEFLRYIQSQQSTDKDNTNPWMTVGKEQPEADLQHDWNIFAASLKELNAKPPSRRSDIGGALEHALLIFREPHPSTRKILLLATDYKNNSATPICAVDTDIEVISVGALPNVPVEKLLHTPNVRRCESMATAIETISSSF